MPPLGPEQSHSNTEETTRKTKQGNAEGNTELIEVVADRLATLNNAQRIALIAALDRRATTDNWLSDPTKREHIARRLATAAGNDRKISHYRPIIEAIRTGNTNLIANFDAQCKRALSEYRIEVSL